MRACVVFRTLEAVPEGYPPSASGGLVEETVSTLIRGSLCESPSVSSSSERGFDLWGGRFLLAILGF